MANGQQRNEELLAASIIKWHFPKLFSEHLRYADMPDLQDDIKNIGIEVVRNLRMKQGEAQGFIKEFKNTPEKDIPSAKIDKLKELGFKPFFHDGKLFGIRSETYEINTDGIYETIEKKLNKLQTGNYRIFRSNRLFIFISWQVACFQRYQILELTDNIRKLQEDKDEKFDVVYLYDEYNGEYDLWACYLKTGVVRKYKPKQCKIL